MARKKIVFVIVEGPSDKAALNVLLNSLYDKNSVVVAVTYGDITTERYSTAGNIVAKIGDFVRAYARNNHYKATDFQEVIHLLDMDGAYVPDDCIAEDSEAHGFVYSEDEIRQMMPLLLPENTMMT